MILIGSMRVRNCKVIVWLLYGYCMVRAGNLWAIGDMSYRHIIVGLAIFCKDITKFSNFQIFMGIIFKKNIYISRRMHVTVCNNSFYVAFLSILILVIRDSRTAWTANFYVSSARMQGRKFKNSCPCCPSVPL